MHSGDLFLLLMETVWQRKRGGCTAGARPSGSTAFLHHSSLRRAGSAGGCAPFSGNAEVAHLESLPIKTPTVPACSELW